MNTRQEALRNEHYKDVISKLSPISVPLSPMLKTLGYGTGVNVYRLERSPHEGQIRSPWAVKRVNMGCKLPQRKELFEKRLMQEAETLKKLNHPNIVGFRKCDQINGKFTLVMEDCHKSLGDMLEERYNDSLGPLPANKILKMSADILAGLAYLHSEIRLLHGDIKSHNVLVKGDFEICKLCDFGVSIPLDEDGTVNFNKNPHLQYVGTDLWSAPEVLDEKDIICEKADIFSFGLVIYETIALVPPHTMSIILENTFDDKNDENMLEAENVETESVIGTRPPLPEVFKLSDDYNKVVEIFFICTNELPENRPYAKDLSRELNKNN